MLNENKSEDTKQDGCSSQPCSILKTTTKSILDLNETEVNSKRSRSYSSDFIQKSNFIKPKNRVFWKAKITDQTQSKNESISSNESKADKSYYVKIIEALFGKAEQKNLNKKTTTIMNNNNSLLSVNINMMDETDQVQIETNKTVNSPTIYSNMSPTNSVVSEPSVIVNQGPKKSRSSHFLVEIRAVILKIGDIDTLNEKFYAEAFIEAKWIDPIADPEIKYDPDSHWNPKLYVLNCLGELKQQIWYHQYSFKDYEKEEEKKMFNSDNKLGSVILERRRISGQFWQTLNLKNFPADVQNLTISFSSLKQANEIELIPSKDKPSTVNIKCFVDSQEWKLYKHLTVREYTRDSVFSSETFPAIDLTINVARKPTFYYWNAFFLIFLITMASLSAFSIRCHLNANRIQTTSTLLLTSVTFKWITNRSLPTVSYLTSLDKYSIASILLLCVQCVWHSIISSIMDLEQKCDYPFSYYDHIAFIMACSLFLFIQIVFILWLLQNAYKKRRELNKQELDFTNELIGKRSTRLKSMLYGI